MKKLPLPTSAPFQERAIDALDKVYSQLMLGGKHKKTLGEGEMRRSTILRERQLITVAKAEVAKMKRGPKGGSAIMRNIGDIEAVLG